MTRDEAVRYAFTELHQTFFDALHALMAKVDARARDEEREACAKVCDQFVKQWDAVSTEGYYGHMADGADQCAEAIRAREENP